MNLSLGQGAEDLNRAKFVYVTIIQVVTENTIYGGHFVNHSFVWRTEWARGRHISVKKWSVRHVLTGLPGVFRASSWYMNKEDVMCRKVVKIDSCGSHTHHTVDNFCPWKFPDKRGWCKHTWGTRIECAVFATIIAIYWIKKSSNHQDQSFR